MTFRVFVQAFGAVWKLLAQLPLLFLQMATHASQTLVLTTDYARMGSEATAATAMRDIRASAVKSVQNSELPQQLGSVL